MKLEPLHLLPTELARLRDDLRYMNELEASTVRKTRDSQLRTKLYKRRAERDKIIGFVNDRLAPIIKEVKLTRGFRNDTRIH